MARKFDISVLIGAKDKASKDLQKVAIAATAIGAAAAAGAVVAIKAASDLQETTAKFETVFSGVQDEANAMAKTLVDSYGLARVESKRLLGNTADLLTGFGFTQEAALGLSSRVNTLAVDLASFTNIEGGAKRASEALTKALLGEAESVKPLGIVINQNNKEYQALVKHYQQATGASLMQAKALAALDTATTQSKNAIGDFARTSASFANQFRVLQARTLDLVGVLGTSLLDTATEIVTVMSDAAKATTDFTESFQTLIKESKNFQTVQEQTNNVVESLLKIAKAVQAPFIAGLQVMVGMGQGGQEAMETLGQAVKDLESLVVAAEENKTIATQTNIEARKKAELEALKLLEAEREKARQAEIKRQQSIVKARKKVITDIVLSTKEGFKSMLLAEDNFATSAKKIFAGVRDTIIDMIAELIAAELAKFAVLKILKIKEAKTRAVAAHADIPFVGLAIGLGFAIALGAAIKGFADGVRNFSGGLALVGERGPELVNLARGSSVISNTQTRGLLAGAGGGGGMTFIFTGNQIMGDDAIEEFAEIASDSIMGKVKNIINVS